MAIQVHFSIFYILLDLFLDQDSLYISTPFSEWKLYEVGYCKTSKFQIQVDNLDSS